MVMGYCSVRRSVACMLLMVALSNARHQPIPNSSPAASTERLESRLVSIEDQLNRMLRIVSILNNAPIKENCTVDLASFGYDDSTKHGYVRTNGGSAEEVYTPERIDRNRGVTLFELDATTCTTKNRQRFDTYEDANGNERWQLVQTLESANTGTIVVGVTADSAVWEGGLETAAGSFFTRHNMDLSGLQSRDKFAFILQKGYPKKTIFQRKPRYGESLQN